MSQGPRRHSNEAVIGASASRRSRHCQRSRIEGGRKVRRVCELAAHDTGDSSEGGMVTSEGG